MIKDGLKSDSKSNGRELEHTIISLQNKEIEDEFYKIAKNILNTKQISPASRNGLKRFNVLFETYIKKVFTQYKTVNVYARNLNSETFPAFWSKFQRFVEANSHVFQGRLEPHPADREINSWHIQYTGANATYVEKVLAAFIVKEGAENSIEMALGKEERPYYETTDEPIAVKLVNDELFVQQLVDKTQQVDFISDLQNAKSFLDQIRQSITTTIIPSKKITSSTLRDRLDKLKNKVKISLKQSVLDDIRSRKSTKTKDIIERIRRQRNKQ